MPDPIYWSIAAANAAAIAFGYLIGSIPFGVVLTRLAGMQDIRATGSGNIGATNVLRTGRKGLAALTLIGDALKGTAAVLIVYYVYGRNLAHLAGLGAFLGHLFPVWLNFKGGKGVATYLGILLALSWPASLAFAGVWMLVAAITRFSSLAGLLASFITPGVLYLVDNRPAARLFIALTLLLWLRHRHNILRLLTGTETKIGQSGKARMRADRHAGIS
jgi:glycerol-3-phosphate acyltransferase PlsY